MLDFTRGTLPSGVTITRASTGTYFDNTLLMRSAAIDTARFDYATGPGLLLEPARTNVVTYSAALDNAAWTKQGAGVSANTAVAPDGTTTADTLTPTAVTDAHLARASFDQVTTTAASFSAFVTANGYAKVGFRESLTTGAGAAFDLNAGTVIGAFDAGGSTVSQMSVTGSRIACAIAFAGATTMNLGLHVLDPTYIAGTDIYASWDPNGTSGVRVWGAQLEVGSKPTSYIPTSGAAATRALETLNFTVPTGKTTATVTYLDNTTQAFTRSPGAATITGAELTGTSFKIKRIEFS